MRLQIPTVLALTLAGSLCAVAGDIEGTVVIKRQLTKRKVAAQASAYERGVAVPPAASAESDPLKFERSHVAIYLEGEMPTKPVTAIMEQKSRRFLPDLLVIPAGATVSFPNHDPIFHNVFSLSKARSFDLGNYPKGQSRAVTFRQPGIVFVNCHLHPNMSAAIVVSPNAWSARPDENGKFTLSGVPPGTYTIVAWHKAAGFFRQTVQVTGRGITPVEFLIPLRDHEILQAGTR
jgi:plastocyanin